ncbi:MAG: amidohydrolase [Planctomycetota bacterium]
MRHCLLLLASLLLFAIAPIQQTSAQLDAQAEMVLVNGNIYTVDDARPNATAIAIGKGRILRVGSDESIKSLINNETEVIDLGQKFVMPGFIEGHAHFVGLGESKMMLNLATAKTWDDVVEQVEEAARKTPPGEWIIGRGWHQSKWEKAPSPNVDGYPTTEQIDKVSPDHPVLLTHASGHMSFANGYAMRLAGVNESTKPPSGGTILKNEAGQPIGVFRETAQGLISRARSVAMFKQTEQERAARFQRAVELAGQECVAKGVTSFQDAGSTLATVRNLKEMADLGKIPVRLWVMIRDSNDRMKGRLKDYKMIGYGDDRLTVRALKRSIDGALGPHGAWLLDPYTDMSTSSGLNTATIELVTETAQLALKNDFQMCVHAIGDRANREVLDIYEGLFSANRSNLPRRWRIEHAQHLHPDDIPRFGQLGVIASMQAVHCTSDAIFVPTRLGPRRSEEGAYVWRSLMETGAIVTNGTDAPVEDVDPIASFYASVTRKLDNGVAFFPKQNMTREEAIRSYTIDCAYAAFEETQKGSLVAGKFADIVVLSNDLLKCKDEEIKSTEVLMTILDGEIVYQKPGREFVK